MMYCAKCGKELSDTARCCSVCGGAPVDTPPAQPVQMPAASSVGGAAFTNASAGTGAFGIWKLFYPVNLAGVAGCLLIALATFLTFASVNALFLTYNVSLMDGADGKLFLVAAVIGIVLCFWGNRIATLVNMVYSVILALLSFGEVGNFESELGDYSGFVSKGAGYYVLLLGALIYAASAIYRVIAGRNNQ